MTLLATRQRGSYMVPMWFRNLTGTTLYRKGFPGRTAAWFPHGSDVAPHFERKQIIAKRHLLAAWANRQPRRVGEELSATRMRVQLPIMTF